MLDIIEIAVSKSENQIKPSLDYRELYDEVVNNRNIVILKSVFDAAFLERVKARVFDWGKSSDGHSINYPGKSFHRVDNLNPNSMTPHVFHSYNFDLPDSSLDQGFTQDLFDIFNEMKKLQQEISFRALNYNMAGDVLPRLRPQIIHYPCGGGYFDYHVHPFEPQRIGLILNLSRIGRDYDTGGTSFFYKRKEVSIENYHDIGDIALFRYDLLHSAKKVNLNESKLICDVDSKGKWSAILPVY